MMLGLVAQVGSVCLWLAWLVRFPPNDRVRSLKGPDRKSSISSDDSSLEGALDREVNKGTCQIYISADL